MSIANAIVNAMLSPETVVDFFEREMAKPKPSICLLIAFATSTVDTAYRVGRYDTAEVCTTLLFALLRREDELSEYRLAPDGRVFRRTPRDPHMVAADKYEAFVGKWCT